ncbi:MAG: transposase, partial [Acidimicrobiia bacterium]
MFVIGIDPHKRSHQAVVIDPAERVIGSVRVDANAAQRDRLLAFAAPFTPRTWAIEGASGLGALLAQQLVAAGEHVVDVPAKLAARVRTLDDTASDKQDSHDARSVAIVGLHRRVRTVGVEDYSVVLRLLARRYHDLTARRTQSVCRLHAVLCHFVEGGLPRLLTAERAAAELRRIRPADRVGAQRRAVAVELLAEVRHADRELALSYKRIVAAVADANTSVTEVYGVGPIGAAILIGYTGDIFRFPTAGHYARYNATAPINASSGPNPHHRLNQKGNRQLNHAIHVAALTQVSHDTPGRAFYLRKQAEG